MSLLQSLPSGPTLRLSRDLVRTLKRGNPWVFQDALASTPDLPAGTHVALADKTGKVLGKGFYDPFSSLAFRMCALGPRQYLDDTWALKRLELAMELRSALIDPTVTTGYRLFNGEGDGIPGLVVDIYGDVGVLVLDGPAASAFWDASGIAEFVAQKLSLKSVYQRERVRGGPQGHNLWGPEPVEPVRFIENGLTFLVDVRKGQKTGFFLDQRDNRQRVRQLAAGRSVLNICGYTGGFSIYAFAGGATNVTTVDSAKPALSMAADNWYANTFPMRQHEPVDADMFEFLEQARTKQRRWQMVILDPPSFAPNRKVVDKAERAYISLIAAGANVTENDGILIAASCSSHITPERFTNLCEEGVSKARGRATLLGVYGQPADHPSPLALVPFRYLKFVVMRLER